ncbi:transporter [candidate division KSB1 bacterium]|nr:transporter [candidate division KSB1 bacterium]
MSRNFSLLLLILLVFAIGATFAQDTKDDVKLFQSFFYDSPITKTMYGQAGIHYASYDGFSTMNIGAQGGYGVNPNLEVDAALGFNSWSIEDGDGESGLSDLFVAGRYLLPLNNLKASAGAYVTLPIGKEEVGGGKMNFGAFAALRHPLSNGMVITGTVGLNFVEVEEVDFDFDPNTFEMKEKKSSSYENSIRLAAGLIYPVNPQLNVVGEWSMETEIEAMMLSGGADYKLSPTSRVRAGLGLGLDDGSPDLLLMATYFMTF